MKTRPILGLLTASLLIAAGLHAAEPAQTKTMLVLDASGSMWGQIGGKTKIAIAREAVDSMLDGWNGGDLGLIAYGHRRKGDCADIEVLQAIGPDTAAGIRKQVNALNPKGMTPITASVRMAAEQLRYTEQKATVIVEHLAYDIVQERYTSDIFTREKPIIFAYHAVPGTRTYM